MNRRTFLGKTALAVTPAILPNFNLLNVKKKMDIQLIRHATLYMEIGGAKFLVDPMLSEKEAMNPIGNCGNEFRIPMVELPFSESKLGKMLDKLDAVFVTHTHRDHWDDKAQELIRKDMPIFCQSGDEESIAKQGFSNVTPIEETLVWKGITIHRTGGEHGTGEIGKAMGKVSGFNFAYEGQSVLVAGDTIWCNDLEEALKTHQPNYIVLNTGGAQFLKGDPITMTQKDVQKVVEALPNSKVIAVHMDTVNHCFLKRGDLKNELENLQIASNVLIPADGETIRV